MVDSNLKHQLLHELERLPASLQARVLAFARGLSEAGALPAGTAGQDLFRFVGTLPDQDAAEILLAIEEGCEQVDPRDW